MSIGTVFVNNRTQAVRLPLEVTAALRCLSASLAA